MQAEKLTEAVLAEALRGLPIGDIHCPESVGSTNDLGLELSSAGTPDMTVITAFEQTKGRGRMNREWITVPGSCLPMTVIIRPTSAEMRYLNLFSPLTGLAIREGLFAGYGIDSRIKWPNDVLLNRRKIAGILCEMQWEGDRLKGLILGAGLNLLHGSAPELPDLTYPASSIEDETGAIIPRAEWIRCFLGQILRLRPLIGRPEFFRMWENCLAYKGESASLVRPDGTAEICTVQGIDDEGKLVVRDAHGRLQSWLAGEITLRPAA